MTQATQLIYKDAFSDMSLDGWEYEGAQPELVSRNDQIFVHLVRDQEIKRRLPAQPDTVYKFKAFVDKANPILDETIIVCKLTELDAAGNHLNQQNCYSQYLNLFHVYAALKTSSECQFIEITLTNIEAEARPYDIYINDVNLFSVEMENKTLIHEDFSNHLNFEKVWVTPSPFSGCIRRPHEDDANNVAFYPFVQNGATLSCATQNTTLLVPGEVYKLMAYMKTDINFDQSFIFTSLDVLTVEGFSYSHIIKLEGNSVATSNDYLPYVGYFYTPEYEAKESVASIGGVMGYIDRIEITY